MCKSDYSAMGIRLDVLTLSTLTPKKNRFPGGDFSLLFAYINLA